MRQLLEEVDSRELSEWIAFDQVELEESWYQTALQCLIAAKVGGSKTAKLEDFLPPRMKLQAPKPSDPFAQFAAWAQAHNARLEE